jgi:hypothetical protein
MAIFGLSKNTQAQTTRDIMWSSGVTIFDIENTLIPNLEFGFGLLFHDITETQSISVDINPSLWLNYNSQLGFLTLVDIPLMLNYNLGHRITNNYNVDSPIGLFAGLGYEYSYNSFSLNAKELHGPAAQIGLRFQFLDRGRSYYAKLRVYQPISNGQVDYPIINIGIGQNF